jgi:hypothetical protein
MRLNSHGMSTLFLLAQTNLDVSWSANLPHLRTLKLISWPRAHAHGYPLWSLLDNLILPVLCVIQVSEILLGHAPVATLASLVSRSRCSIEKLYISPGPSTVPCGLYQQALPSVTSIYFDGDLEIEEPFMRTSEAADGRRETETEE